MALRKTHIVVSELVITTGIYYFAPQVPILMVSCLGVWIGAQLPDVDLPNTRANHWFGPFAPLLASFKHRTWTHSIVSVLLLLGVALFLPVPESLFDPTHHLNYGRLGLLMICAGDVLHLLEDAASQRGIPWLYPFLSRERAPHRWYYRTGGRFETIVRRLSTIILWVLWYEMFRRAYLAP